MRYALDLDFSLVSETHPGFIFFVIFAARGQTNTV
jgi:hypothetical protein